MALTLAQIQSKIVALNTLYDSLASKLASEQSIDGRDVTWQQMKEVREEIVYWESREADADDDTYNGGVALAEFGNPR